MDGAVLEQLRTLCRSSSTISTCSVPAPGLHRFRSPRSRSRSQGLPSSPMLPSCQTELASTRC